jgi:hypothetical protein
VFSQRSCEDKVSYDDIVTLTSWNMTCCCPYSVMFLQRILRSVIGKRSWHLTESESAEQFLERFPSDCTARPGSCSEWRAGYPREAAG